MKKWIAMGILIVILSVSTLNAFAAAPVTYEVVSGDTMWKIAVRYQVGVSELIQANPQITDPDWIYPGQMLDIPVLEESVSSFEKQVIALANQIRIENGLAPLTENWELSRVARYKSQDMRDMRYFSHTSPIYGAPGTMIRNFGIRYSAMGENIAMG